MLLSRIEMNFKSTRLLSEASLSEIYRIFHILIRSYIIIVACFELHAHISWRDQHSRCWAEMGCPIEMWVYRVVRQNERIGRVCWNCCRKSTSENSPVRRGMYTWIGECTPHTLCTLAGTRCRKDKLPLSRQRGLRRRLPLSTCRRPQHGLKLAARQKLWS